MRVVLLAIAVIVLLVAGVAAQAVTIDTVRVGNAGNLADTWEHSGNYAGQGSVAYNYNIGKYEVTAAQYCEFLNAKAKTDDHGLWNSSMSAYLLGCNIQRTGTSGSYSYSIGSGSQTDITNWGNRPVNYVTFWNACRFANWMNNGQGNGDTETGAYTLGGYNDRDGRTIHRNTGWQWAVTSEDEWYKAAYYDPNKPGGAGYWNYATRSNISPANQVLAIDAGNSANYYINDYGIGFPYYRTNVGEFENSASAYGTFDQTGNVWEWNEGIPTISGSLAARGLRGGSYNQIIDSQRSSFRNSYYPMTGLEYAGIRLSQAVPEPSSIIGLGALLTPLLAVGRRRT
jgi:sulfatase modifying factor 1